MLMYAWNQNAVATGFIVDIIAKTETPLQDTEVQLII